MYMDPLGFGGPGSLSIPSQDYAANHGVQQGRQARRTGVAREGLWTVAGYLVSLQRPKKEFFETQQLLLSQEEATQCSHSWAAVTNDFLIVAQECSCDA